MSTDMSRGLSKLVKPSRILKNELQVLDLFGNISYNFNEQVKLFLLRYGVNNMDANTKRLLNTKLSLPLKVRQNFIDMFLYRTCKCLL